MKITSYFLRKKVCALAAKATVREHHFCSLAQAKYILVMYEAMDREVMEPCLETLRMMHKQVRSCVYVEGNTLLKSDDTSLVISKENDLNVWYFPTESTVRALTDGYKTDLLIDLTSRSNSVMQYLLLRYPCLFKVGIKRNDLDLYDLSISETGKTDVKYLFGQILFYLQAIRSPISTPLP